MTSVYFAVLLKEGDREEDCIARQRRAVHMVVSGPAGRNKMVEMRKWPLIFSYSWVRRRES